MKKAKTPAAKKRLPSSTEKKLTALCLAATALGKVQESGSKAEEDAEESFEFASTQMEDLLLRLHKDSAELKRVKKESPNRRYTSVEPTNSRSLHSREPQYGVDY